jgi:hypothetical protein
MIATFGYSILFAILAMFVVDLVDWCANKVARKQEYELAPVTRSVCVNGKTHITVKYMRRVK